MSHFSSTHYQVISQEELDRRKRESIARECKRLKSQLEQLNKTIFEECRKSVTESSTDTLKALRAWQSKLESAIAEVREAHKIVKQTEERCLLLSRQLTTITQDLRNPSKFQVDKPSITSMEALNNWETLLRKRIAEATEASKRDATFLSRSAQKKLDMTGVSFEHKNRSRITEIRVARRMKGLEKLADRIGELGNQQLRENFTLEASTLIEKEDDTDFDDALIDLNTRVRTARRRESWYEKAQEIVGGIAHLPTQEADVARDFSKNVYDSQSFDRLKAMVKSVLEEEERSLDDKFVREALAEALKELGYDYGEGFEQTEFGSVAIADKNPNDSYALRFQVQPKKESLLMSAVAREETTPEQDIKAETALCKDQHALIEGLHKRGVQATIVREVEPGMYPIDNIGAVRSFAATRAQKRQRVNAAQMRRAR